MLALHLSAVLCFAPKESTKMEVMHAHLNLQSQPLSTRCRGRLCTRTVLGASKLRSCPREMLQSYHRIKVSVKSTLIHEACPCTSQASEWVAGTCPKL